MAKSAEQKVYEITSELMGVPAESFTSETTLESLGVDDLDCHELLLELEEEFDKDIEGNSFLPTATLGEIIKQLEG